MLAIHTGLANRRSRIVVAAMWQEGNNILRMAEAQLTILNLATGGTGRVGKSQ